MSDVYREAASVLLLKPVGDGYQMLLLHKPRKNDAWQLPQGGKEAQENATETALRELSEEAGITACRLIGTSKKVYQYEFPASFRRFRPDNVCGQRIAYVFALAEPDVHVTVDEKEVNNFRWIDPGELPRFVRRREYRDLIVALYEEALAAIASPSA
jgi:putative (di)nucleoside polyphosphate hydrolase